MNGKARVDAIVVGSGAGGAVTAYELARAGMSVVVLEEGARVPFEEYGAETPRAMRLLYRRGGMTPILGPVPIGFVEGACVGGSTEINSGFWHRAPPEALLRWRARVGLLEASPQELEPHFAWAEELLGVGEFEGPEPASTRALRRGVEAMAWAAQAVPRTAAECRGTNACANGCPTGAKRSMARSLVPMAEEAGAVVLSRARAKLLIRDKKRVTGVLAEVRDEAGRATFARVDADHVFVCAGPTETPALLLRSGIRRQVGDTLRIHPMLKVAARFPERIDAHKTMLPALQVREFWPEITLGGAFFSPGHLALTLSDNWPAVGHRMRDVRNMATFYVAARGTGRGSVRISLADEAPTLSYRLSEEDLRNLSRGLARLAMLLLAGGAEAVYPAIFGVPEITTPEGAARWLDELLPPSALSLSTVHAFSTCPTGEKREACAADSFGRIFGQENLYVNDASALPDSPGVNPQGTIMAFARRNAHHFLRSRA